MMEDRWKDTGEKKGEEEVMGMKEDRWKDKERGKERRRRGDGNDGR